MKKLIDSICKKNGLSFAKTLELGCNSDFVGIANNRDGLKVVIKAGKTENSIAEIKMNSIGYDNLRKCGLSFFIPEIFAYESGSNYAFMIMEYLGPNFLYQAKNSENPLSLYLSLIASLERVYSMSLSVGSEGCDAIESLIAKTVETYEKYVFPVLDINRKMFSSLQGIHASIYPNSITHCCFSNWDFTLEDVYMTAKGVKYSDPHIEVLGVPIIDMACFGGLVKLYDLPFGNEGYEEFKKFAIGRVAEILQIPSEKAHKIFYLGKLFQCFMSIRFRYKENPDQAGKIFLEASEVIENII